MLSIIRSSSRWTTTALPLSPGRSFLGWKNNQCLWRAGVGAPLIVKFWSHNWSRQEFEKLLAEEYEQQEPTEERIRLRDPNNDTKTYASYEEKKMAKRRAIRQERISLAMLENIQESIFRHVDHPIQLIDVNLNRDFSVATVRWKSLDHPYVPNTHPIIVGIQDRIEKCTGKIRFEVTQHISIRYSPMLRFVYDDQADERRQIAAMLELENKEYEEKLYKEEFQSLIQNVSRYDISKILSNVDLNDLTKSLPLTASSSSLSSTSSSLLMENPPNPTIAVDDSSTTTDLSSVSHSGEHTRKKKFGFIRSKKPTY